MTNLSTNHTLLQHFYDRMIEVDPNTKKLTEDERSLKAITWIRYMQLKAETSSTSTLGFSIERIKVNTIPPRHRGILQKTENFFTFQCLVDIHYSLEAFHTHHLFLVASDP